MVIKAEALDVLNVNVWGVNIADLGAASLILIMVTMGLTLKSEDFSRIVKYPKATVTGLIAQLLLLPTIAFVLVAIFNPPLPVAAGLIILSCCPGGATSNFFTHLARGDVALSVSLTTLSALIVIFTLPFFVNFGLDFFAEGGKEIFLPVIPSMLRILVLILVPVGVGMFIRHHWPRGAIAVEPYATKVSMVVILFTMVVLLAYVWPSLGEIIEATWQVTVILNVTMMSIGFVLAKILKLGEASSRSIAIETGVQNYVLSVVIAVSILERPDFVIVSITYLFTMYVTVFSFIVYCRWGRAGRLKAVSSDDTLLSSRPS